MNRKSCLLFSLCLLAGGRLDAQEVRPMFQSIVNGSLTHDLPSVGLVLIEPSPGKIGLCTGTLIGCRTVLTAAHCFCGEDTAGSICRPQGKAAVWFQNAGAHPVSQVAIHPQYRFGERSDLAVLRLAAPVTGIAPSAINTVGTPPVGTLGRITGFGRAGGEADGSGLKRDGLVMLSTCPPIVNAETHLCWDFSAPLGPKGVDSSTCQGDSGGPLLANPGTGLLVVGVTSGGPNKTCLTPNTPFDADVFLDRSWIQAQAGADIDNRSCGDLPQAGSEGAPIQFGQGELSAGNRQDGWRFEVPDNTGLLRVAVNGEGFAGPAFGGNDFDLEIRSADGLDPCAGNGDGVLEFCEVARPAAGEWVARVDRSHGSGAYQLTVTSYADAANPASCVPGPQTLCLGEGGRFRLEVDWRSQQGQTGRGSVVPVGARDSGIFTFFDPNNWEVMVKVLNGCSFSDRMWVFFAATTNQQFTLRVTDT